MLVQEGNLPVEKRLSYLKIIHPNVNFVSAQSVDEACTYLKNKYSKHFFETHNVDYDTTCLEFAKENNFTDFKKELNESVRYMDARRLFNDIRTSVGLDAIKEEIKFEVNELREKYVNGEIYNIGEFVTDDEKIYEIIDRGSNHLIVVDSVGNIHRKWIESVKYIETVSEDVKSGYVPNEVTFKGYTTKNLHHSKDAIRAFRDTIDRMGKSDPLAVLNALKNTDIYMKVNDLHLEQIKPPNEAEMKTWISAHTKARDWLTRIGEFAHHFDYWNSHEQEMILINTKYGLSTSGAEMSESIVESEKIDTKSKYNLAKSIMSYKDFLRMQGIETNEPAESDAGSSNVVGSTIAPDQTSTIRKMKVKYKVDETLDPQLQDKDIMEVPRTSIDIKKFVKKAKHDAD